jgi:hypothetical protein
MNNQLILRMLLQLEHMTVTLDVVEDIMKRIYEGAGE